MNNVLLFSAGLVSLIAWNFLEHPKCLHITGHAKYWFQEMEAVLRTKMKHPEMKIEMVQQEWMRKYEEPDANIPGRNSLFAHIAAHYGDTIYLVCQRGEQSIPDRSPEFFEGISKWLTMLHGKVKVVSPVFAGMTKADMVAEYLKRGFPAEDLYVTYSCITGNTIRCGECKMCSRLAWALDYSDILPSKLFSKDIWAWSGWKDYIRQIKNGSMESRRAEQTMFVLRKRGIA